MTKREQIKMIDRAWLYVGEALNNIGIHGYGRQYLALNMREEKDHRRFCPEGIKCGLTTPQAARLFCVKQLADYLNGEVVPTAKDFIHIRQSNLMAASLVANYRAEIKQAFSEASVNPEDCSALDYAELNK